MNEENAKLRKLRKISKVAKWVLLILEIFMIIMMVLIAVIPLVALFDSSFFQTLLETMDSEGVTVLDSFGIYDSLAERGMMTWALLYEFGMLDFSLLLETLACHFFYRIFRDVQKSDNPFSKEMLKKMKKAFIALSIVTVFWCGLLGVVFTLFIWCVYAICEYGHVLQSEIDETL